MERAILFTFLRTGMDPVALGVMEGWEPATIDDLTQALAEGVLEEGTHVEFKALVGSGTSEAKEWARDVAAMAVTGGRIYVGVAEPKDAPPGVEPVALAGLAERLEQIAATRAHPPVYFRATALPEADGSDRGVLVVTVPASPRAPHMVDNRYWRRLDRTKAPLSDVEVRDLLAQRARTANLDEVRDALEEMRVDETRWHDQSRIMAAAIPVYATRDMFHAALPDQPTAWVMRAVAGRRPYGPSLTNLATVERSGRGLFAHSGHEPPQVSAEVFDSGHIRTVNTRGVVRAPSGQEGRRIMPVIVAGHVLETLLLARQVSRLTGYNGAWDFGVLAEELDGVLAYSTTWDARAYRGAEHLETYRATAPELDQAPYPIMQALVGRFLRAVGQEHRVDLREMLPADAAST